MERDVISRHEVQIFRLLSGHSERWFTNKEIAEEAKVAERTAREHSSRMVKLGLLDMKELFPGYRYRWANTGNKRDTAYLHRLRDAARVFDGDVSRPTH